MLSQGLLIMTAYPIKILNQINITNIYNWVYSCNVKCMTSTNDDHFKHLNFIWKCHFCFPRMTSDLYQLFSKWTWRREQWEEEHSYSKISRPAHEGFIRTVWFWNAPLKSKSDLVLKSKWRSSRISCIKLIHLQHFTQALLIDSNP